MNGITKETFLFAEDSKNRDAMLFEMLETIDKKIIDKLCGIELKISATYDQIETCKNTMEPRIVKLENRKKTDTAVAGGGGVVGGIVAQIANWFLLK